MARGRKPGKAKAKTTAKASPAAVKKVKSLQEQVKVLKAKLKKAMQATKAATKKTAKVAAKKPAKAGAKKTAARGRKAKATVAAAGAKRRGRPRKQA